MPNHSQFNIDRTSPGLWTITLSNPPCLTTQYHLSFGLVAFCIIFGAGNLACSRLLGGFAAPRESLQPCKRRLKAGGSQDWLPRQLEMSTARNGLNGRGTRSTRHKRVLCRTRHNRRRRP
jgi:hypothetical protein